MPELANRDSIERRIVGELEPIFERQYRRALASPSAIPYGEFQAELTTTMTRELSDVFQQAGVVLLIGNAVVVSAGAFEQAAQQWASGFAPELAREVVNNSREKADAIVREAHGDPRLLREELATVFMSDSRLESIAITEVTRSISAGEHSAIFFYHRDESRPRLIPIWRTARDASVCPHCAPLEGHSRDVWGETYPLGPPGHPRCRCWIFWQEAREWARRAA